MSARWADELEQNIFADARLESFYLIASLQLGDPRAFKWIERNAEKFYRMWNEYTHQQPASRHTNYDGPEVMLQYLDWYEKEFDLIDRLDKATHS